MGQVPLISLQLDWGCTWQTHHTRSVWPFGRTNFCVLVGGTGMVARRDGDGWGDPDLSTLGMAWPYGGMILAAQVRLRAGLPSKLNAEKRISLFRIQQATPCVPGQDQVFNKLHVALALTG